MIKLGELLLIIGTLLFIAVGFLVEIKIGMIVTAFACMIWGVTILRAKALNLQGR